MVHGIPVISTRTGGIPELLHRRGGHPGAAAGRRRLGRRPGAAGPRRRFAAAARRGRPAPHRGGIFPQPDQFSIAETDGSGRPGRPPVEMNDATTSRANFPATVAEATARFFDYYRALRIPCQLRDGVLWIEESRWIRPIGPIDRDYTILEAGSPARCSRIGRRRWLSGHGRIVAGRPDQFVVRDRRPAGPGIGGVSGQDQEHGVPGAARERGQEGRCRGGCPARLRDARGRVRPLQTAAEDQGPFPRHDVGRRRLRRRHRLLGRVPRRRAGGLCRRITATRTSR